MLDHLKAGALIVASAAMLASPSRANAQSATRISQTDPRWYAWLGCWAADASETGEQSSSSSTTCIVPISGSSAVEALTIARHKVVARDRLDSSRPHALDGQGCDGMEAVNWSQSNRRVFVRADYTCTSGVRGTSTTLFAFSPLGEWIRIEQVRAGDGTTLSVSRLRDIGLLSVVSAEAARAIDDRRREIATARAAAAAGITAEEIADATYALNAGVVRAWIYASDQRFNVDVRELASLAQGDLPLSVLQTLAAVSQYQAAPIYPPASTGNVYMNSSSVNVAPEVNQNPYNDGNYQCSPFSTLTCVNPYSAFNGFGSPFGFPIIFVTTRGFNNDNNRPFRGQSHGHDGSHGNGNGKWNGSAPGRWTGTTGGRTGGGGGRR